MKGKVVVSGKSDKCKSCDSEMVTFETHQMTMDYTSCYWYEDGKKVEGSHSDFGLGGSDSFYITFCPNCGKVDGF
jgi:hypothetical protein